MGGSPPRRCRCGPRQLSGAGGERPRRCEEREGWLRSRAQPSAGCGNRACAARTPLNSAWPSQCRLTLFAPASSVPSLTESCFLAGGGGEHRSGRELAAARQRWVAEGASRPFSSHALKSELRCVLQGAEELTSLKIEAKNRRCGK